MSLPKGQRWVLGQVGDLPLMPQAAPVSPTEPVPHAERGPRWGPQAGGAGMHWRPLAVSGAGWAAALASRTGLAEQGLAAWYLLYSTSAGLDWRALIEVEEGWN